MPFNSEYKCVEYVVNWNIAGYPVLTNAVGYQLNANPVASAVFAVAC